MSRTFLCFKVLQAQQHDFGRVLKEGGSVLLLPFLHPVAVDAEGAAVDEFAHTAEGVRISGQHLAGQRPSPAVPAVHPDAGQHAHYQHLRGSRTGNRREWRGLEFKITCHENKELSSDPVTHPKCLSGAKETHILPLVLPEEGMRESLLSGETDSWFHHQKPRYLSNTSRMIENQDFCDTVEAAGDNSG